MLDIHRDGWLKIVYLGPSNIMSLIRNPNIYFDVWEKNVCIHNNTIV